MSTSNRNADRPTAMSRLTSALPALILLVAGLSAYGAITSNAVVNGRLEFDEVGFLVKAWWYISGALKPFSAADATPTMPLYPYALGALQTFIGLSASAARIAMAALGLANGVLLYLLCRKLTANALAATAAALIFLGTPATAYSFATATPVVFVSFLHLVALWLIVLGLGRPRVWRTVAMGVVLTALPLASGDMLVPSILLGALFIAAAGRARLAHAAVLLATAVAIVGAGVYLMPDQFTTYLLYQPIPLLVLNLAGLVPVGAPTTPAYDLMRLLEDGIDGVLLPYGGTIMLCVVLLGLTLKGPRVLWVVPLYLVAAALALIVFRTPGCDTCAATAPSQIIAIGAVGAAMALAFLARWRRQKNGAGAPLIIGGAVLALAINTFAPGLATREALHFFPAEMVKQARPAAEQEDIAALMRVIGEHVPGTERVLLLHKIPALPYAVHTAGRRFPATSLNPIAALRSVPAAYTGAQREAMLAAVERNGGWSGETLRRWVERDFDVIIMQDNILALDQTTAGLLASAFDVVATADFRGAKLSFYKRKG